MAKDRAFTKKPAPQRAGFLLCTALVCVGSASAQSIPMRISSATPNPAPAEQIAPEPPSVDRPAVEASTDYVTRMDADRDGRVSLVEYQAWLSYAFARMDGNGDGVLSTNELPGGRGNPISQAEHRQTLADRFARQDRNRDGFLDAQELLAPPQ